MKIKKGDYFDILDHYGKPVDRVVALTDDYEIRNIGNYCMAMNKEKCIQVDCDNEVKEILGNVFD